MARTAESTSRMDEAALIRAAQAGDQDAFEHLVRNYDQNVLRLAMNLLRSRKTPTTSIRRRFSGSTATCRAFASIAAFTPGCIASSLTSASIISVRRKYARPNPRSWRPRTAPRSAGFPPRAACSRRPQRSLLSRELRGKIEEALTGMTARERMVFEMRHYQGMRLRAIGEALGTTEEAAKNCLFRATQKMRSALGEFV